MQHLQPDSTLQVGKYKIIRFISSGGFGCTYEGVHVLLKKRVAIKEFFVKDFCNRDESTAAVTIGITSKTALVHKLKDKFIEEAQSVCALKHSHIVNVYDVFEENGTAYYVMDYIDGLSLNDIVKRSGALTEKKAMKYILQVSDALKHVHSYNRLHLDVKPGNIMIDDDDNAILIDFGTSKQYDEVAGENTSTLMGMTPGYAPLEQMGNDIVKFTPSTDVYALGATLYKLLTGITPLSATLLASGEDLQPIPSSVSWNARNAVYKAMQINKKKRPQSIDEFVAIINTPAEPIVDPESEVDDDPTVLVGDAPRVYKKITSEKVGQALRVNVGKVEFRMIYVEGGTFDMKETVACGFLGLSSKEVVQKTTLSNYYIGETQVTQELWQAVMGSNPSSFKGNRRPVERVSWNDCQTFISKLNSLTGKRFRLPTEAEWEFASRGGTMSRGCKYSGSNTLGNVAWYDGNSGNNTHDVGTKSANELGVYDMSGNVWEWCQDWYGNYSNSSQTNPTGAYSGSDRVLRGGSWCSYAWDCCVSFRYDYAPDYRNFNLGLRLALSE